jgi:hypothetical protein
MKKIALLAAVAVSLSAHASTTSEYTTAVRWTDAKDITQFQGQCTARFGTTGIDPSRPLSFDLNCPSFKNARVLVYRQTKLASIDGWLPARVTYPVKDTISLFTAQGETLTFVLPDCTKNEC